MDFIERIALSGNRLHHFYLVEGGDSRFADSIEKALDSRKQKGEMLQVYRFNASTLGVEEAGEIRARAQERGDGEEIYLIAADAITREAQQSLLKIFEEPRAGLSFFLVMQETGSVLPTVRSRAQYVKVGDSSNVFEKDAQDFIGFSKDKRVAYVASFIKSHEDDEMSGALRLAASQFIQALITTLRKDKKNLILRKAFLGDAISMRGYLDQPGASVKMLLEHLALTL